MTKQLNWKSVCAALALFTMMSSAHAAKVGESAPAFEGKGTDGKSYKLEDFKGKYVVLEWHNQGCPFVKKHYEKGNMQKLQAEWTKKGVVWLSVISSAPGKQGFVTAAEEKKYLTENKSSPTAVLMDSDGTIGRAYDAKTTPHMFVIHPSGKLVYAGAIDDKPSSDSDDIPTSRNYVQAALEESLAGKPVTTASTQAYGCGVKYGSK